MITFNPESDHYRNAFIDNPVLFRTHLVLLPDLAEATVEAAQRFDTIEVDILPTEGDSQREEAVNMALEAGKCEAESEGFEWLSGADLERRTRDLKKMLNSGANLVRLTRWGTDGQGLDDLHGFWHQAEQVQSRAASR